MGKIIELTGQKFGKLTVIGQSSKELFAHIKHKTIYWECLCECGKCVHISRSNLKIAKTCGCERGGFDNLKGKVFGRLTVLKRSSEEETKKRKFKPTLWDCICVCGKETRVMAGNLKKGISKSCGCLRVEVMSRPTGRTEQRKAPGESGFNRLYRQYKYGAKGRNLVFDIPKEKFRALVVQDCFYCKASPSQVIGADSRSFSEEWKKLGIFTYNGLDRTVNELGYTVENVVPCCGECNYSKKIRSTEQFKSWIKRLAANIDSF